MRRLACALGVLLSLAWARPEAEVVFRWDQTAASPGVPSLSVALEDTWVHGGIQGAYRAVARVRFGLEAWLEEGFVNLPLGEARLELGKAPFIPEPRFSARPAVWGAALRYYPRHDVTLQALLLESAPHALFGAEWRTGAWRVGGYAHPAGGLAFAERRGRGWGVYGVAGVRQGEVLPGFGLRGRWSGVEYRLEWRLEAGVWGQAEARLARGVHLEAHGRWWPGRVGTVGVAGRWGADGAQVGAGVDLLLEPGFAWRVFVEVRGR
ncbi:hypothetical protein [Marinithermus hydrothermalis]|uniref:Uncharacterized protein n=1 Tax=Marinithermus hydrothermalis (strain DSM 14884 / JCM 11576 / T1) TaxID=869210 RepID=F2NMU1_MARHT|nr:hypothetical protein [Marinithermus hydrothermalis]AEB12475.1 hypothetical protein Marky_1740 [Marinithermus hydrothermalis DSM 14884]